MMGAVAGMAWRTIAASAYQAYCIKLGIIGPDFTELTETEQHAWEAAVRQTGDCLKITGLGPLPDELRWQDWKPP